MSTQEERAERARNGSRRKADLAALAAIESEGRRPPADITPPSPAVEAAWSEILDELAGHVSSSAFQSWLEPLRLLGERNGALAIGAPARVLDWFEARFGALAGAEARKRGLAGVYGYELVPAESEVALL